MICQSKSLHWFVEDNVLTIHQGLSEDWFFPSQHGAGSRRCWSLRYLGKVQRRTCIRAES